MPLYCTALAGGRWSEAGEANPCSPRKIRARSRLGVCLGAQMMQKERHTAENHVGTLSRFRLLFTMSRFIDSLKSERCP
eukprot:15024177-Alexandrium_andersonii.AAC.1